MPEEKQTPVPEPVKEETKTPTEGAPTPAPEKPAEAGAPPAEGEKKAPRRSRRKKPTEGEAAGPAPPAEGHAPETVPVLEKMEFDFQYPPLFGRWDWKDVNVADISLKNYINLDPVIVPHVGGKYANKPFGKHKMNIVERLINIMMRTEHTTGNKAKTYKVVMLAFDIINQKTKKNPIQVFIEALEVAAPKEEITRLKYGGISVPKAVDVAASRRLDVALRNICKGATTSSRKNKKRLQMCLADEIMKAAASDMQSYAISKKDEIERIAASAR
jgi:small subunit ribosomal protein S7